MEGDAPGLSPSTVDQQSIVLERTPSELVGRFRVERTAGVLPLRFAKRIGSNCRGVTTLGKVPLFPFRVVTVAPFPPKCLLRYVALPIQDELVLTREGWHGRGFVFGREFCRFKLVRTA